jgi:hypothetical protein
VSIVVETLRAQYTRTYIQVRGAAKLVAYHHKKATDEEARLHLLTDDLNALSMAISMHGGKLPDVPVDEAYTDDPVEPAA